MTKTITFIGPNEYKRNKHSKNIHTVLKNKWPVQQLLQEMEYTRRKKCKCIFELCLSYQNISH
jgi:hypothetical protein